MEEAILVYKKKKYINWFIENCRLKLPETVKILEFLIEREELLANTHFVRNIRYLPNALLISAVDTGTVSFLCRIGGRYYEDLAQIMVRLGQLPPQDFFVWLSWGEKKSCPVSQAVLTDKPEVRQKLYYHQVIKQLEQNLTRQTLARERHRFLLLAQIDLALERRDRKKFLDLTARYKRVCE